MMNNANSDGAIVLIVEDVESIRRGMKRLLTALGFRVMEAENVEDAVAAAERVRPSLILTEEDVPDFHDLTERLREHPTLLDVPVVMVNPDAEDGARYGDAIVLTGFDQLKRFLVHPARDLERK